MLPYAAYLRVYEPVAAFPEPLRSVWTAYAESGRRPRRAYALEVEHGEAIRRLASTRPVVAPDVESPHAYVRRVGDTIYVSPWETRLRSWLAFERLRDELRPGVADAFLSQPQADRVAGEFERWKLGGRSMRPHILSSTWHVPSPWFVPFDPAERYLLLGGDASDQGGDRPDSGSDSGSGSGSGEPGQQERAEPQECAAAQERTGGPERTAQVNDTHGDAPAGETQPRELGLDERIAEAGPAGRDEPEQVAGDGVSRPPAASPARTLIYVTTMGQARHRVDQALVTVRGNQGESAAFARVGEVADWLAGFHPQALVELDYGGLVHLIDDETLRADESVAEVSVALAAMRRGETELTVAMYKRLRARWQAVRALESAN